jgi:hypothetical protein
MANNCDNPASMMEASLSDRTQQIPSSGLSHALARLKLHLPSCFGADRYFSTDFAEGVGARWPTREAKDMCLRECLTDETKVLPVDTFGVEF